MAVLDGRDDLPEEVPGLALRDALSLAQVVVQISSAAQLHHDHDLVLVLKHCSNEAQIITVN